jgi:hypothetical protein
MRSNFAAPGVHTVSRLPAESHGVIPGMTVYIEK